MFVLFYSSDVGQREQEKSRLEKQYQESDRRLDNLIQGLTMFGSLCQLLSLSDYVCPLFSERELKFMFAICHHPSVCRLSSVTFVRPTQMIEIFRNVSMP